MVTLRDGKQATTSNAQRGKPRAPKRISIATVFDGRKALNELVNRDLAGVFRQLKQRIEQVVQSHEDATLAYKISNLVNFYCTIFAALLGESSTLLETLNPLSDTALRSFRSVMRDYVASLQTDLSLSPEDLAPPEFLTDALDTLQVLMKSYDTSVVSQDRTQRIDGFQPILQDALDPFLKGCENIATRLPTPDKHIFALNFLLVTKEALSKWSFVNREEDLRAQIEEHESELTDEAHIWFLHESGLHSLVDNYVSEEDFNSLYKAPNQLAAIAQQLDAFLPSATEEARAFLGRLEDRAMARRIIERAADRFCQDFEGVDSMIAKVDETRAAQVNGDTEEELFLKDVFPRTGDEIRVLLS